jgi:hypothetical protein
LYGKTAVVTDSDLIDNGEITIKVLPEDEVIAQDKSRGGDKEPIKVEGTRPIIAQITKPTIVLKPIEFDTTKNNSYDKEIAVGLGLTPFVWYNGYQINERDIKSLDLWYEGLVPNARLVFADSIGFMKKEGFPLDDTKFEIFLNFTPLLRKNLLFRNENSIIFDIKGFLNRNIVNARL